jgi:hypothetical protein
MRWTMWGRMVMGSEEDAVFIGILRNVAGRMNKSERRKECEGERERERERERKRERKKI